ncbi:MAG: ZIP family metal transporter [Bacilli bacterium]|nr:ZIP family metal transporter [Bacilli bacterium]
MDATISSIISIAIILLGTTLGSLFVFFIKKELSDKWSSIILGFAGGIMMAAALLGLIVPAIEESQAGIYKDIAFLPPLVGFVAGGVLLWALDKMTPHMHLVSGGEEGVENKKISNELKFFLAVTIHNIPEGLSVGFAAGLALANPGNSAYAFAVLALAIGIAIQNVPEGLAVSVPLYSKGMKKSKAFLYGFGSGVVEPIAAVIGLFIAQISGTVTPWLLAFAGGAMIYVILDELIPESRKKGFEHFALWSFMIGFAIMMTLELVL